MLSNAIQENGVKSSKDPNETDRDVFVPVHDLIYQIDEDFRNYFKHEFWFEVFCRVSHYH